MTEFAAIILAGGQSSRMGQDKALIEVRGMPLLQKTCLLAAQHASQVYVITPWIEKYRQIVPDRVRLIQEVALPGDRESHGPLVGFAQAFTYVNTAWVLLLACDLPYLTADAIAQWATYLETTPEDAIALLPKSSQGWEPLCGFYRSRCLSLLDDSIARGDRSFQKWLAASPVQELPITDPRLFFNCNTPADLAQVRSQ
jgi:molybdenum cofactor guanylyltransferase